MQKMKQLKNVIFSIALLVLVCLTGCNDESSQNKSESASAQDITELTEVSSTDTTAVSSYDNSDKNIRYVMIDSYVMLSINNNRINFSDYDNEDVLKSKFNIYSDGNYFGKYYIRNLPTGLKIIDDSNNFIKNDGYLIGDTSNDSIRVSKINVEDAMISDYIFANDVLKDAGVSIGFNSSNSLNERV